MAGSVVGLPETQDALVLTSMLPHLVQRVERLGVRHALKMIGQESERRSNVVSTIGIAT